MFEENNFNTQQNNYSYTPPTEQQNNYAQQAYTQPPKPPKYTYGLSPEIYQEKQEIRKLALLIAIPCLCLSIIGFLWTFVYIFLARRIAGMSYEQAIEFAQNPAMQQVFQIVLSCIMFLIPFSIAVKSTGRRIDRLILFNKVQKGYFLPYLLFGIGFCSFANIAMNYASAIFDNAGIDYEVDYGENPTGVYGFLLSFIATAIVPALVEEFACRGIVLGLLKKYGEGFAIITSAIVFGIMHGNFDQIPFAVFVGLILGYVYVKTNSIWVCVVIHCVNNAISIIFTYLQNLIDINAQNILYIIYLTISILAAILSIYIMASNKKEDYSLKKSECFVSEKQKYKFFFSSWAVIVFIVLNFIESLAYFKV